MVEKAEWADTWFHENPVRNVPRMHSATVCCQSSCVPWRYNWLWKRTRAKGSQEVVHCVHVGEDQVVPTCTCIDFWRQRRLCKHTLALLILDLCTWEKLPSVYRDSVLMCWKEQHREQHLADSWFQIVSLQTLTSLFSFNYTCNLTEKFPIWIRFWKQCGACFDTRNWGFTRKHQARLIISCACSAQPPHFVIHHRLPGCFLYILSNGSIFICNPSQNF